MGTRSQSGPVDVGGQGVYTGALQDPPHLLGVASREWGRLMDAVKARCRTLPICWGLQANSSAESVRPGFKLQDPPHLLGVASRLCDEVHWRNLSCRTLPICWGLQAESGACTLPSDGSLQDPPHLLGVASAGP